VQRLVKQYRGVVSIMRPNKPKVPPVFVVLVAAILMWGASAAFPMLSFSFAGSSLVALAFFVVGIAVAATGASTFASAGTTTDPLNPDRASSLVTHGIFRYTRNPMYLGMAKVLTAWALLLGNAASLLVIVLFVAYMTQYQIKLEELALQEAFGDEYARYKSSVRRWI